MLAIFFGILMLVFIGEMIGVAVRAAWSIFKIIATIIFLPIILIAFFAAGLFYIAIPVLIIAGVIGLVGICAKK